LGKLTIYRASAGSGKTFTLTREFIDLLIELPENFQHILAVTFTNKATGEMKSRILAELDGMTSGKDSVMLDYFVKKYQRTEEQIRERARRILDNILHNYSRFHVVTIDSFFQGVIRSFARELDLTAGYNVELDIDKVLSAAIDNLFNQLGDREELLRWMVGYTRSRISEGKGWKLKDSIKGLGKELFKEAFQQYGSVLGEMIEDRKKLKEYQSRLYAIQNAYLTSFSDLGKQAMQLMDESGLTPDDFSRKSSGIGGFFRSAAGGIKTEPTATVLKSLDDIDLWIAKNSDKRDRLETAYELLNPVLAQMIRLYQEDYHDFRTAESILKHIYILGILTDLSEEIYTYTDEQDIFLVSDSARFLKEIVDKNEAPFIYEKTGNYLEYFMIDEFQDTSGFQWENFKPLLQESLAMNRKSLVVGDVKQSIYRWRNSDWEILGQEINLSFDPEQVTDESLLQNWRSQERIILFNNAFFTSAKDLVAARVNPEREEARVETRVETSVEAGGEAGSGGTYHEKVLRAYSDVQQEIPPGKQKGAGSVRIDFIGEKGEAFFEAANMELIKRLEELLQAGISQKDIAILVRKKADGQAITDLLLNYNNSPDKKSRQDLNVISNESLYLVNSTVIKFIISVLTYMVKPDDQVSFTELIYFARELEKNDGKQEGDPEFTDDQKVTDAGELFLAIAGHFKEDNGENPLGRILQKLRKLRNLPLNELTEEIIFSFDLHKQKNDISFLAAFQDVVLDYSRGSVNDISSFLEWWDENSPNQALNVPEEQEAIRILTIHKAKGLQFRIVLIPYCNWKLDHEKSVILWCHPAKEPFKALPVVPVNYSSRLTETIFNEQYYEERFRIHVDNLNLLYVAFTRAIDALYVMMPGKENKKDEIKDVKDLAFTILSAEDHSGNFRGNDGTSVTSWQSGELSDDKKTVDRQKAEHMILGEYAATSSRGKLKMKAGNIDFFDHKVHLRLDEGKLMHRMFELIRKRDDVPQAVRSVVREGKLTEKEADGMIERISGLMDIPLARDWFDGSWLIRNEQDILHPSGMVMRPDRIMYRDEQIVVVDYKFGSARSAMHAEQVTDYLKLLLEMGEKNVKGYIWYVNQKEIMNVD